MVEVNDIFIFTLTGKELLIKTVTEKKVVWYTGFVYRSGAGTNNMRTATTSRNKFEAAIERGAYVKKAPLTEVS